VNDVTYIKSYVTVACLKLLTFEKCENSFTNNNTNMKKNEDSPKYVQNVIKRDPLLKSTENGFSTKVGRNLKKLIIMASLAGIGLFLNGCVGGYIATEPSYAVVSVRPPQPTNAYIWIDGDWAWNNQTHLYVQRTGYWEKPRQSQIYVSGHWQSSPRGKYWVAGHWQKQTRQSNHGSR
jgi:hypothetical protein